MADFLPKQSKGTILKGMMRNPEISKVIRDAVSSPLGSTNRMRAKKIVNIMEKLHATRNGIGGPGMMYERINEPPQNNYSQPTPENPRGIVIFHKIPKPNIIYGERPAPRLDGEGGPGKWDGKGGIFDATPFKNFSNNQKSYSNVGTFNSNPYLSSPIQNNQTTTETPVTINKPSGGAWTDSPLVRMVTDWSGYWDRVKENQRRISSPTPAEQIETANILKERQASYNTPSPIVKDVSNLWNAISSGVPKATKWENLDEKGNPKPGFDSKGYPLQGYDETGKKIEEVKTDSTVPTTDQTKTELPSATDTEYAKNWNTGMTGYGAEILPGFDGNRLVSSLTPEERQKLNIAQKAREGSTLPNNPYGIKLGSATKHWVDEGLARVGSNASDGGQFLVFKDPATAEKAHDELLYDNPLYSGLTVDAALKKWSGYGPSSSTADTSSETGDTSTTPSKSYSQTIWDKYNITQLQDKETEIFNEGRALSAARNRYLLQTDAAINGYMDKLMKSEDMSNPANVATASSQLKYLYTLRGNATQSYLGMLNTAIEQNQTELSNIDKMYGTAITAYENELQYPNKITPEQYALYQKALNDMYNTLGGSDDTINKSGNLAKQFLTGTAQSAADSIAAEAKINLIAQKPKIESYWGWDGTKTRDHIPNLVDTMRVFASQATEIQPSNIIATYLQDVLTYADSVDVRQNSTGTNTPSAINPETKQSVIQDAIKEFANLYAVSANDPVLMNLSISAINNDLIPKLTEQVSNRILPVAQQLMTAVQTLAPGKSWLGGNKATPTESEFIANVKKATGDNAVAIEVAPMIYREIQRSMVGQPATATTPAIPAQTREQAVKSLLYQTSSTGTVDVPVTPAQFASRIGDIYAGSLYSQYFVTQ